MRTATAHPIAAGAAIAIASLALLGGCGEDDEERAGEPGADTAWVLGSWTGELRQRGMPPFRVWATVRSLEDPAASSVRYSGLACEGTWTPLGGGEHRFRFRETITSGRSETCKGVGVVSLRRAPSEESESGPRESRDLLYRFRGGGVESRGVLRRQSEAAATEPERDAMAQTESVRGAPGRALVLSRVTVPPGATLPLHRHRGTQVARVESGTLTYTVRTGSVVVRSGQSDGEARVVRRIRAGETAPIRAREWIVEQPTEVHRAANTGERPVVIYLATLLEAGAPPATPVGD